MNNVHQVIEQMLELSVFAAPLQPGLSTDEILEVGNRLGLQPGEIKDYLQRRPRSGGRQLPLGAVTLPNFFMRFEPEFRNESAFEFVLTEFKELARQLGESKACSSREALVSKGAGKALAEIDVQAAITTYVLCGVLAEEQHVVQLAPGRAGWGLPSQQSRNGTNQPARSLHKGQEMLAAVRDVISRRTDGRLKSAEPRKAFASVLNELGHARFRLWWSSTSDELAIASANNSPLTMCVLSASLAEGALTFVVRRAQELHLGTMASTTFTGPPSRWRFEDLLASAAKGGSDAIFDEDLRRRADRLNSLRQRIHPGRLLDQNPTGPIPDLRPEEAREAVETLDKILRRVLDWIEQHPHLSP